MATEKVNSVRVYYGPRATETKAPSKPLTAGAVQQLVVPIVYNTLPTTDATDAVILSIPAGAVLKSATLIRDTLFDSTSGTTTVNIGFSTPAGVVVDVDGIDAALAWDGAAGTVVLCDGADVGTVVSTTSEVQVTVVPSVADLIAGEGRLVLEYIPA